MVAADATDVHGYPRHRLGPLEKVSHRPVHADALSRGQARRALHWPYFELKLTDKLLESMLASICCPERVLHYQAVSACQACLRRMSEFTYK